MSLLKLAGAVVAIAAGAIVLHSHVSKEASAPDAAPKAFEDNIVGFLMPVAVLATYVAGLAEQGIKAFAAPGPDAAPTETH